MNSKPAIPVRLALALAVGLATLPGLVHGRQEAELRDGLEAAIGARGWGNATWGVLVRSLDTGETLFERNARLPLAPASNLKLLTTAAALHVLGPEYRFRTYVLADGIIREGVVHGNLVLYGTGDPAISDRFYRRRDEVLHRLVDQLEAAGIHTITGDIVADASFFEGPLRHDGWERRDLNERFTAGVSALSYNENVVSFQIIAGPLGTQPEVRTVPSNSGLEVVNTALMVAQRSRPRLAILRDDPLEPVRIEGRMVAGSRDVWRQMTVSVPARFALETFRETLRERGLTVVGGSRVVDSPARSAVGRVSAPARGRVGARIVARHVSHPLRDYLLVINKESNNLFAELVLRAVGRASNGEGSFDSGARTVKVTLADMGVDTAGLVQRDGSGLAGNNRVSAQTLVQTIEGMGRSALWPQYWASLPEAGSRRELRRMYRTAAAGNLRAKTGTIDRVSALSGMVRSADGERLAFSLMVNDSPSQTRAKRAENLIGARLASFRRTPADVPVILAEGTATDTGPAGTDRHRVARGENLSGIASRYGVSLDAILQVNPWLEPNQIVPGEWIDIPQQGGS